MAASTIFYPPIMPTYQPAFPYNTGAKISFTLSPYDNPELLTKGTWKAEVTVSYQNTNTSALTSDTGGILPIDTIAKEGNLYSIVIPSDKIKNDFEPDTIYKVQVRFKKVDEPSVHSEWSTVCLIKSIYKPQPEINGFDTKSSEDNKLIFTIDIDSFVGRLVFLDKNNNDVTNQTKEQLKSYRFKIYDFNTDELYYDSGLCYATNNSINHTLKRQLEDGNHYKMEFTYATTNEYTSSLSYRFSIIKGSTDRIENARVDAEGDAENGRIKVMISPENENNVDTFFGNIAIRRASSKTDFKMWEDVHYKVFNNERLDYTWYDYTIESGVWYRYAIQKVMPNGVRSEITITKNEGGRPTETMVDFDDIFLTRNGIQFKVKYNPTVSSFKRNILESKTDTLGSRTPFTRRNGDVNYKVFPVSGLITAFCDEEGLFFNKDNIYRQHKDKYNIYNLENQISDKNDYIYEREFREKIMDFLYEDALVLFRSQTEGNVLVKLMELNFTPNQQLGRMLYTFTANAYEKADCTVDNFDYYNIQKRGELDDYLELGSENYIGDVKFTGVESIDVCNEIREDIENQSNDIYKVDFQYLNWVKIDFESAPRPIKAIGDSLEYVPVGTEDSYLGYIIILNGIPTMVGPQGYYELRDPDTKVTSLVLSKGDVARIDYRAYVIQIEESQNDYSGYEYKTHVDQIYDMFKYDDDVFLDIYYEHLYDGETLKEEMLSINECKIEAVPGTAVSIKFADAFGGEEDYQLYVVPGLKNNELIEENGIPVLVEFENMNTGYLEINQEDMVISGLKLSGKKFFKRVDDVVVFTKIETTTDENGTQNTVTSIGSSTEENGKIYGLAVQEKYFEDKIDTLNGNEAYIEVTKDVNGDVTFSLKAGYEDMITIDEETNSFVLKDGVAYVSEAESVIYYPLALAENDYYYVGDNFEVDGKDKIINPVYNCVYLINGKHYIYHDNEWLPFDLTNETAACDAEMLVDYIYESQISHKVKKGENV